MADRLLHYMLMGSGCDDSPKAYLSGAVRAAKELTASIAEVNHALRYFGKPELGGAIKEEYQLHCEPQREQQERAAVTDPLVLKGKSLVDVLRQAREVFHGECIVREYRMASTFEITFDQLEAIGQSYLTDIPQLILSQHHRHD